MKTENIWVLVGVPALLCLLGVALVWFLGPLALLLSVAAFWLSGYTLLLVSRDEAPALAQEPAMYAAVLSALFFAMTALFAVTVTQNWQAQRAAAQLCPALEAQNVPCEQGRRAQAALLAYLRSSEEGKAPDLSALQAEGLSLEVLASEGTASIANLRGEVRSLGVAPTDPVSGTYALVLRSPRLPPEAYFGELEPKGEALGNAHFAPKNAPLSLLFVWQQGPDWHAASGKYLQLRDPERWLALAGLP